MSDNEQRRYSAWLVTLLATTAGTTKLASPTIHWHRAPTSRLHQSSILISDTNSLHAYSVTPLICSSIVRLSVYPTVLIWLTVKVCGAPLLVSMTHLTMFTNRFVGKNHHFKLIKVFVWYSDLFSISILLQCPRSSKTSETFGKRATRMVKHNLQKT